MNLCSCKVQTTNVARLSPGLSLHDEAGDLLHRCQTLSAVPDLLRSLLKSYGRGTDDCQSNRSEKHTDEAHHGLVKAYAALKKKLYCSIIVQLTWRDAKSLQAHFSPSVCTPQDQTFVNINSAVRFHSGICKLHDLLSL